MIFDIIEPEGSEIHCDGRWHDVVGATVRDMIKRCERVMQLHAANAGGEGQ